LLSSSESCFLADPYDVYEFEDLLFSLIYSEDYDYVFVLLDLGSSPPS
jgi:hypothetical protein